MVDPLAPRGTQRIARGVRSPNSRRWEMIPMCFPVSWRRPRTCKDASRASASRLPNPSSMNSVSSLRPPDRSRTTSARPKERARDPWKLSPPERVEALRTAPVSRSSTSRSRPALAREGVAGGTLRSAYRPNH